MRFSLVILAGGRSSRMGQNKCVMTLAGRTLVEHILAQLGPRAAETFIVANDPNPYRGLDLPIYPDSRPGLGPLGGLATALSRARQERVLLTACDMPFVHWPLVEHMLALAQDADVVMAKVSGEAEPLRAVYARACLPAIQSTLRSGERRMISFLARVGVHYLTETELLQFDPQGLTFFNLNTPEDFARAEKLVQGSPGD